MSFVDELELVLNRAQEFGTAGPHSCEILVKYRARLLAAVRLAENAAAVEAFCRANESNPTKPGVAAEYERLSAERENALTAYRTACAGDSETGRLENKRDS